MTTKRDYYTILGIEKNASKQEIKKAFHKLARHYHPDNKETGDESKFKEINEAYQTLSDDRKRAEYDSYGHVFGGASGSAGFGGFAQGVDFDLGDIFNEFFSGGMGGRRTRRGRDIAVDLTISFNESVFGTERRVLIAKTSQCETCRGSGAQPGTKMKQCSHCNGKGQMRETHQSFLGTFTGVRECGTCNGTGNIPEETCSACRGVGIVKRQEEIPITVPAGIQDGEVIRLSGMGEAIPGGAAGDLYVRVHVERHPVFRRDGHNLVVDLDVKLTEALLGAEYDIETLEGGTLKVKVPAGVSFGEVLRIRGKGVPVDRSRRGDLLVKLHIKLPKRLSRKAKKLVEQLSDEGV